MGVGFVPRVLVVCVLAAPGGARGAEEQAATAPTATTTATATATPTATVTPTATAMPTGISSSTATTAGAPVSMSIGGVPVARGSKQPPPAIVMVPLVGMVLLPLSLPTSVPHARQEAGAKETKP